MLPWKSQLLMLWSHGRPGSDEGAGFARPTVAACDERWGHGEDSPIPWGRAAAGWRFRCGCHL